MNNESDHVKLGPTAVEEAVRRVTEWLTQFNSMVGLDPEMIHRANRTPLLKSDLQTLLALGMIQMLPGQSESEVDDSSSIREGELEIELREIKGAYNSYQERIKGTHRTFRDKLLTVLSPSDEDGRQKSVHALVHEAVDEITSLRGALRLVQRDYIRIETQRDELRRAICRAAGLDPDKVSEVDTDYLTIAQELGVESKRLEDNEDFLVKVLHAVIGCCADPEDCRSRAFERLCESVRRDEVPQVDQTIDVRQVLMSSAREYAMKRNEESGGEHDIDDQYWEGLATHQAKSVRFAQSTARHALVRRLRGQIRAWKAEKRTGKELGTPNEIARDDGYAGGRVDAAHELEYLLGEITTKEKS